MSTEPNYEEDLRYQKALTRIATDYNNVVRDAEATGLTVRTAVLLDLVKPTVSREITS